jgi:hypothetical protein
MLKFLASRLVHLLDRCFLAAIGLASGIPTTLWKVPIGPFPSTGRRAAMTKTRRRISAELKAEIALEAMRDRISISDIAARYGVHPNQVYLWKKRLRERAACAFDPLIAHLEKLDKS